NLTAGTFVAGGRNRRTRLAVMDAAAVDNQRRLVLVRRDDVEHLILIGGPTDVVVEQNIGLTSTMQRNHPPMETPVTAEPRVQAPPPIQDRPPTPERQRPVEPVPAPRPEPVVAVPPALPPQPKRPPEAPGFTGISAARPERIADRADNALRPVSAPVESAQPAPAVEEDAGADQEFHPAPVAAPVPQAKPQPSPVNDIDRALAREIETAAAAKPAPEAERPNSLEDEMSRLLGELSRERG
ncbi:MAG: hypothetical protein EPN45_24215, partial [Rhizobiaceae bacterium]